VGERGEGKAGEGKAERGMVGEGNCAVLKIPVNALADFDTAAFPLSGVLSLLEISVLHAVVSQHYI